MEETINKDKSEQQGASFCERILVALSYLLVTITFPFSMIVCLNVVQEFERAVLFRLGKLTKRGPVGPGLFFIAPCIDTIRVVDLRTVTFDVPPQEVLTKDSVTVQGDHKEILNYKNNFSCFS